MSLQRVALVVLLLCVAVPAVPADDSPRDCAAENSVPTRLACRIVARSALMPAVAAYKAANDLPIYDDRREAAVLDRAARRAAGRNSGPTLLFVQIQMDLAKQVQAAWMASAVARSESSPPAPTELSRLRVLLDSMAGAIAGDLKALRQADSCDRDGFEKALAAGLAGLDVALEETVARYYALMLATAACAVEPYE